MGRERKGVAMCFRDKRCRPSVSQGLSQGEEKQNNSGEGDAAGSLSSWDLGRAACRQTNARDTTARLSGWDGLSLGSCLRAAGLSRLLSVDSPLGCSPGISGCSQLCACGSCWPGRMNRGEGVPSDFAAAVRLLAPAPSMLGCVLGYHGVSSPGSHRLFSHFICDYF